MSALLTIVIPVYNREDLVLRTLNSVAASTSSDFRLVVVDNASTDSSYAVCQGWVEEHRKKGLNVELLMEPTPGAPAARNRGLSACETPWVYFFDSDDLFDDLFVASFIEMLPADDVDMFCFPIRQEVNGHFAVRSYIPTSDAAVHVINSMLSTPAVVFRTSWLRMLGGWNEHLEIWQDWELGLRALLSKPRLRWFTGDAFHHIIVHPDSITGRNFTETVQGLALTMNIGLQDVRDASALTTAEKQRLQTAFYFRARIMAGKLAKEGNEAGRELFHVIAGKCGERVSMTQNLMAHVLEVYTAHGGRGAWRLVLWMLK